MYLKTHQPDLGIDNPYELEQEQFNAAVDLLKDAERKNIGEYWPDATKKISSYTNGDSMIGSSWQYQTSRWRPTRSAGRVDPAGRRHDRMVGHLDAQLGSSESELHARVDELDGIRRRPDAAVAGWFGEAPANLKAC